MSAKGNAGGSRADSQTSNPVSSRYKTNQRGCRRRSGRYPRTGFRLSIEPRRSSQAAQHRPGVCFHLQQLVGERAIAMTLEAAGIDSAHRAGVQPRTPDEASAGAVHNERGNPPCAAVRLRLRIHDHHVGVSGVDDPCFFSVELPAVARPWHGVRRAWARSSSLAPHAYRQRMQALHAQRRQRARPEQIRNTNRFCVHPAEYGADACSGESAR